jgi:hypothetical protein
MTRVPLAMVTRDALVTFLSKELGTEDPLRMTVHLIMSTPEYQIV